MPASRYSARLSIVTAWVALVALTFAPPSLAASNPEPSAAAQEQSQSSTTEELLERADEIFLEDGREEEALDLVLVGLDQDPDSVDLRLKQAEILNWLDRESEALRVYSSLIKEDPSSRPANIGYAEVALRLDRYSRVIRILDRYLLLVEGDTEAQLLRGEAYLWRGDHALAVRDLEAASQDPELPDAGPLYALALNYNGQLADAVNAAGAAVKANEDDAYAHHVLAITQWAVGAHKAARKSQARAEELDPDYASVDYQSTDVPKYNLEGFGRGEPTAEELAEAYRLMFQGLLGWALLMGIVGFAVGLGGGRYLKEPPALRAREGSSDADEGRPLRSASRIRPKYDGPVPELLRIYLQNVAFTILTLGVYRFWAKVRTRRFHYEHTEFAGGRFDYHATGQEKFIGFLKGMVILLPILVGYYFASQYASERPGDLLLQLSVSYGLLLAFFLIRPLALVGSQQFNLARTSWNNLHFRFTGTLKGAYKLYGRDFLFIVLTLGFYFVWHQRNVHEFKLKNTTLGKERMDFKGRGGELFGIQIVGMFLSIVTLGLYVPWWIAQRKRFFIEGSRLRGRPFRSSLSGLAVLAVGGPGMLVSILTLGLGLPWAITRWRRLLAVTTQYVGTIDPETISSIRDTAATSTLEGVGEAGELIVDIGDLFGL